MVRASSLLVPESRGNDSGELVRVRYGRCTISEFGEWNAFGRKVIGFLVHLACQPFPGEPNVRGQVNAKQGEIVVPKVGFADGVGVVRE